MAIVQCCSKVSSLLNHKNNNMLNEWRLAEPDKKITSKDIALQEAEGFPHINSTFCFEIEGINQEKHASCYSEMGQRYAGPGPSMKAGMYPSYL